MTKRPLAHILTLSAVVPLVLITMSARAVVQERRNDVQEHADEHPDRAGGPPPPAVTLLPTGQFITPTALDDAIQQPLNPGLAAYPDFIAGEAVRSRLSPDRTTLAIITAGQNSLYKADGTVDVANSTQYLFLYDVQGDNS